MPELVCVVAPANVGWVLESIATSVATCVPADAEVHLGTEGIPACDGVLYTHYSIWLDALRAGQHPGGAAALVLYTHPSHPWRRWPRVIAALNRSTRVLSMSSIHASALRRRGLRPSRVRVEVPGIDSARFPRHDRTGHGSVVLNSAYYPRKQAETWIAVARELPSRTFELLGRGWLESPHAGHLSQLSNVRLHQVPYERYAGIYRRGDVFLSTSALEGGPMPLIEAMLSNLVPVVSATGFGPDLVADGRTGFTFPVDARPDAIAALVERAFALDGEIRTAVEHLTPERYAEAVWREVRDHRLRLERR